MPTAASNPFRSGICRSMSTVSNAATPSRASRSTAILPLRAVATDAPAVLRRHVCTSRRSGSSSTSRMRRPLKAALSHRGSSEPKRRARGGTASRSGLPHTSGNESNHKPEASGVAAETTATASPVMLGSGSGRCSRFIRFGSTAFDGSNLTRQCMNFRNGGIRCYAEVLLMKICTPREGLLRQCLVPLYAYCQSAKKRKGVNRQSARE